MHIVRPNKLKLRSVEQRTIYFRAVQGEWVARAQKNPDLPEEFLQSIFKGKVREGCPRVCDQLRHYSLTG